jgi:hypothetical protein
MHSLEVIVKRNQDQVVKELCEAFNDGDMVKLSAIEDAVESDLKKGATR